MHKFNLKSIFFIGVGLIAMLTLILFIYHKSINPSNKASYLTTHDNNSKYNDYWFITFNNRHYTKKVNVLTNAWAINHFQTRYTLNKDAILTNLSLQLSNINVTHSIDFCMYAIDKTGKYGTKVPIYGELSEKLCFRVKPAHKLKNITKNYNFSKFPLYMPKGITLIFGSIAFGLEQQNHLTPQITIKLTFKKYNPHMPVYTLLRLPYLDIKSSTKTGYVEQSRYIAPVGYPLKVRGLIYYLDINKGQNHSCLEWHSKNGMLKSKYCLPEFNLTYSQPYVDSTQIYTLNWNLTRDSGDYIVNNCSFKYKNKPLIPPGNCILWALVEIPPSVHGIPAVLQSWGFIPREFFKNYCKTSQSHVFWDAPSFATKKRPIEEVRKQCITNLFKQPTLCKNPLQPRISYIKQCSQNYSNFLIKYTKPPFISDYYIRYNFLGNSWNKNCKPTFPYDICENKYKYQYLSVRNPRIERKKQGIFWIHAESLCGKVAKPIGIALTCR